MARTLLSAPLVRTLAAAFACSTSGCLALQDQPYIGDFPVDATVNHPPVILEALVEPPRPGGGKPIVVKTGDGCGKLEFRVRLYDTDVSDTLYVRWFVDYDEQSNNGTVAFNTIAPNTPPLPSEGPQRVSPVRNEPGVFEANLVAGPLADDEFHTVEAMIADHREYTTREEPFRLPEPGVPNQPSPRTTFAWFIDSERTSCL